MLKIGLKQREALTDYFCEYLDVDKKGFTEAGLLTDHAITQSFKYITENTSVKTEKEIVIDLLKNYSVLVPLCVLKENENIS